MALIMTKEQLEQIFSSCNSCVKVKNCTVAHDQSKKWQTRPIVHGKTKNLKAKLKCRGKKQKTQGKRNSPKDKPYNILTKLKNHRTTLGRIIY